MTEDLNTLREALNLALTWHDAKYEHPFIKQALEALSRLEATAVPEQRCRLCDCTGDTHSIDGEWRGECPYCKPATVPELSREDVVRMAREAGLYVGTNLSGVQLVASKKLEHGLLVHLSVEDLRRFASLVRSVPVGGQS